MNIAPPSPCLTMQFASSAVYVMLFHGTQEDELYCANTVPSRNRGEWSGERLEAKTEREQGKGEMRWMGAHCNGPRGVAVLRKDCP